MLPHSPDPNKGFNPPIASSKVRRWLGTLALRSNCVQRRRTRSLSTVTIPAAGGDAKIALHKGASPLDPRNTVDYTTAGAFTLTGSARMSLRYFVPACFALRGGHKLYTDSGSEEESPPASPTSSIASTTPSISRTASDFAEREELEAVARGGLGVKRNRSRNGKYPQIHTVLDSLERGSRVGSGQVVCAACMKKGTNFPQCKRCTQMWCSRECRVTSHRCVTRRGE